jgi:hypothetical protein
MIFRIRCCNPRTTFTAGSLEFFGNDPRKNAIKAMRSLVACTSPAAAKLAAGVDGLGRRGAFRASPDLAQGLQGGGRVGGGRAGRRPWTSRRCWWHPVPAAPGGQAVGWGRRGRPREGESSSGGVGLARRAGFRDGVGSGGRRDGVAV